MQLSTSLQKHGFELTEEIRRTKNRRGASISKNEKVLDAADHDAGR
jgi:hypothetical protein